MWNNFLKIKSFSIGSFVFSILSLVSLILMIVSLNGTFVTFVKEGDAFYEYLFYKEYLVASDNGMLYTEYFSHMAGYILIGIFLIFLFFSLFFKISLYRFISNLTKNDLLENNKINFLLISKFNIVFGTICGILLLSTLSVLIDIKKEKINELL